MVPKKPREEGIHEGEQCEQSDLLLRSQLRTEAGFSDMRSLETFSRAALEKSRIKNHPEMSERLRMWKEVETVKQTILQEVELCKGRREMRSESLEGFC